MIQKSKARWIKLGDSDTNYCSAILSERTQKKGIVELKTAAGIRLTEQGAIKEEIINFCKRTDWRCCNIITNY